MDNIEATLEELKKLLERFNISGTQTGSFRSQEKIQIVTQMPCGCPVGTHNPECASAQPCPHNQ